MKREEAIKVRFKVLVSIGLVLAFLAAACAPGAVAPPAKPGDRTGVSDTSIKWGYFGPQSGPFSAFGIPIVRGTQFVIEEANAAGGVNGRKIELLVADDVCENEKAVAEVKRLVEVEKVFLIGGGACSGAALAAAETLKGTNVPFLHWASATPKGFDKNIFYLGLPAEYMGLSAVNFAVSYLKAKRLAIFRENNVHGETAASGFAAMVKKQGLELVADERTQSGATDMTAQILRLKEAKADAVYVAGYHPVAAIFLRQARELGFQVPFIASGGASVPEIMALAPPEAFTTYYGTLIMSDVPGAPKFKDFDERYLKKFPGDVVPLTGKINMYVYYPAGMAMAVVEGLKKAGKDLTREGFISAFESIKNFDAGGLWPGPTSFGPDDHTSVKGLRYFFFKEPGKWEAVDKFFTAAEVMK